MGHFHKSGLCIFVIFATCSMFVSVVTGTGTLLDPPSRGSMWKEGFKTGTNYNYMQQNCGGVKQDELGPRQCGVCGDPVDSARPHELGQTYGTGTISRYYEAGVKEIKVRVELQAFEKGFFEFRICPANNKSVTQECLNQNLLPIKEGYFAGMPMRFYPNKAGDFRLTVAVPPNMTCDRCVIQWRYRTANSWGLDPVSNEEGMGKGPQEEFYNCADIRIGGEIPASVRNYAPALKVTDVGQDQTQSWSSSASLSFDQSTITGSNISPSMIPPITVTGDLTSGQPQTPLIDASLFDVQNPPIADLQEPAMIGILDPTIVTLQDRIRVDQSMTGIQNTASTSDAQTPALVGVQEPTMFGLQNGTISDVSVVGLSQSSTDTASGNTGSNFQGQAVVVQNTPTIVTLPDPIRQDSSMSGAMDSTFVASQGSTGSVDSTFISSQGSAGSMESTITTSQGTAMTGSQDQAVIDVQPPIMVGVQDIVIRDSQSNTVADTQVPFDSDPTVVGFQDLSEVPLIDPIGVQDPTVMPGPTVMPDLMILPDQTMVGVQDSANMQGSLTTDIQDSSVFSVQENTNVGLQDAQILGVQDQTVFGSMGSSGGVVGQQDSAIVGMQDQTLTSLDATVDRANQVIDVSQPLVESGASVIYQEGTGSTSTELNRVGSAQDIITTGVDGGSVLTVEGKTIISGSDNVAKVGFTSDQVLTQPSETAVVGLDTTFDNTNQLTSSNSISAIVEKQNKGDIVIEGNRSPGMIVEPLPQPTGMVSGGESVQAKTFIGRSSFPPPQSISQQAIDEYMLANMAAAQPDLDVVPIGGNPFVTTGMTDQITVVSSMDGGSGGFVNTGDAAFPRSPPPIMVNNVGVVDMSGTNSNDGVAYPNPPPPIMVNNDGADTGAVFRNQSPPPPPILVNNVGAMDQSGTTVQQATSTSTSQSSSNAPIMIIKSASVPGTVVDTVAQSAGAGTSGTISGGTISNSEANIGSAFDKTTTKLPDSTIASRVLISDQVPASQLPPIVPVIPTMKTTTSVQTDVTSKKTFEKVPIVGSETTVKIVATDGATTIRKSVKDPFEHLPSQSLAVIPIEADTNAVKIDLIAGQGVTSKDGSVQAIKSTTSDTKSTLNINKMNLPVDKGPTPVSVLSAKSATASDTKIMSASKTIKAGSTSRISSNILDLRNVQSKTGNANTNILTLGGGETLKASIEIHPDKVKNGDTEGKVDILGSDITILSSGKQFLGQGLRDNRNVTIAQPPTIQRQRFRFVRDPRTGMMTRVPISDEPADPSPTDRRVSTSRNGAMLPEYIIEGTGRRGNGFQGFVPGQFRSGGQMTDSSGIITRLFGDVSGRRPIFPFGMGNGQGQVPTVMGPGMVRNRMGVPSGGAMDSRGLRTGDFATRTASFDGTRAGVSPVDATRPTGGTGFRGGMRSAEKTSATSGAGDRSGGTGTGGQQVLRPDSVVGAQGDTRRGTTALFLRPDTMTGSRPSTDTGGFIVERRPVFGGFPGMTGVAGTPFMAGPSMSGGIGGVMGGGMGGAMGGGMGGTMGGGMGGEMGGSMGVGVGGGLGGAMGGGMGGVPGMFGMPGGGFGGRGLEGLRALDLDGFGGGDFFPRTVRTFRGGLPGASPFSPLMSFDGLM